MPREARIVVPGCAHISNSVPIPILAGLPAPQNLLPGAKHNSVAVSCANRCRLGES